MVRGRSRDQETEDVVPRRLKRGAVKRVHVAPWAIGRDEIAPGVVGENHLGPRIVNETHIHPETVSDLRGAARLLIVAATAAPIASGGDRVQFDSTVYNHRFDAPDVGADAITWPVSAVGEIQVEFAWTSYTGGGRIEIEVDGDVPPWGLVADGTSGQKGCGRRSVHISAGASVAIKVTQTSGFTETADVFVEFVIPDPADSVPSSYEAVVLGDGPIAYWRLGETSGTTAIDRTGNGHDGTYVGTRTQGADAVMDDGGGDLALALTAVSASGVNGADWSDLEFGGLAPYSIECWFNATTVSGFRILVQKQVGTSGAGWELSLGTSGGNPYVTATRGYAGAAQVTSPPGVIEIDADHHVAVTFDGTTARLYVDGVLVDSNGGAAPLATNSVTVSIGYDSGDGATGFGLDGRIDEVAIYGRALAEEEIVEHNIVGRLGA